MTNWQTFKTTGRGENWNKPSLSWVRVYVNNYIEYKDGYAKCFYAWPGEWYITPCGVSQEYVEIDIDVTRTKKEGDFLPDTAYRIVPRQEVESRNMLQAASADPTILAITREGMNRVDNNLGEREFEYKIEDSSGIKHTFIYRRI